MAKKIIGYCLKCGKKYFMKNAEKVIMKNGKNAMKGTYSHCGTKMFKFISTK